MGVRLKSWFAVVSLLAAALAIAPSPAGATAPPPPSTWSSVALTPSGAVLSSASITSISCVASGWCMVGTDDGRVLSSSFTSPRTWTSSSPASGSAITGLACTTKTRCYVSDDAGELIVGTAAGSSWTWVASTVVPDGSPTALACTSDSYCALTTDGGAVYTSTSPATGPWSSVVLDGAPYLTSLSCWAATACAAGDLDGNVWVQSSASSWGPTTVNANEAITAISCTSGTSCLVGSSGGDLLVSADLSSGTWKNSGQSADGITSVDCFSTLSCVATSRGGRLLVTSNAGAKSPTWSQQVLSSTSPSGFREAPLTAMTCWSATACLAGDAFGNVLVPSSSLTGAWTAGGVAQYAQWMGPWCRALCATVDGGAAVSVSGAPLGNGGGWVTSVLTPTGDLTAASCPSLDLCVAVDDSGAAYWTSTPLVAGSWTPVAADTGYALLSIDCPSRTACVAVDSGGAVVWTNAPTGKTAWKRVQALPTDSAATLTDLSCASATLCVATDDAGGVWVGTAASGVANAWSQASTLGTGPANAVSCTAAATCVVAGADGGLTWSSPTTSSSTWYRAKLSNLAGTAATGVSCLSLDIGVRCAVVSGDELHVAVLDGGSSTDLGGVQVAPDLGGVWCQVAQGCVVAGHGGLLVAGSTDDVRLGTSSTSATATGVTATWSAPSITPGQVTLVATADGQAAKSSTVPGASLTASLVGLTPGLSYNLSLVMRYGFGDLSVGLTAVQVGTAPSFTLQPKAGSFAYGTTYQLSAAADGSPAPNLQWYISDDAKAYTAISGATTASYTVPGDARHAGVHYYQLRASNALGSASSSAVTVNCTGQAPKFSGKPASAKINFGASATLKVAATGTPTPTLQWMSSSDGITFHPIALATGTSLVVPGDLAHVGTSYYLAVATNPYGSVNSATATVVVSASAPKVTKQPVSAKVTVGKAATLKVTVTGTPTPTLQWYSSGNDVTYKVLAGATASSVLLPATTKVGTTYYKVCATNALGTSCSNVVTVTATAVGAKAVVRPTARDAMRTR